MKTKPCFIRSLTLLFLVLLCIKIHSQRIAINTDASTADPSAILDIKSNTMGLLIPRMTTTERTAISPVATGLIVYDITTQSVWFYNGGAWTEIKSGFLSVLEDNDGDTKIEVEQSTDEDIIHFTTDGTEYHRMDNGRLVVLNTGNSVFIGQGAGKNDDKSDNNNVFIGHRSGETSSTGFNNVGIGIFSLFSNAGGGFNTAVGGYSLTANTSGSRNTGLGHSSLNANTMGTDNVGLGHSSMNKNTIGIENAAIGAYSLSKNVDGNRNIVMGVRTMDSNLSGSENKALGDRSMFSNSSGSNNTALGRHSLYSNQSGMYNVGIGGETGYYISQGNNNTFLGFQAGKGTQLQSMSGSIFLGYQAGFNETLSNRLYIENSDDSAPLIYGEFDNDIVGINGSLGVGTNVPDGSAQLEVKSNTKGFLLPRLSYVEIAGINNPADGLQVYNTDDGKIYVFVLLDDKWKELQYGSGEILLPADYELGNGSSCSNTTVNGSYYQGVHLDDIINTITIEVTVNSIGTWNITTNIVNGYSFNGSGTFSTTGVQQVMLSGSGVPTNIQTDNFLATANYISGNCTFNVSVSAFTCGNPINYAGQSYNTVLIGNQCWMAENLNVGLFVTGNTVQTDNSITEKYCYLNNSAYCNIYGGLYQWDEMMQYVTTEGTQGICPDDWHLPTDSEWTELTDHLGGISIAGGKMKEAGFDHWDSPNTGATNSSGFTGIPGGDLFDNTTWLYINQRGFWWSSTENDASSAHQRALFYNAENVWPSADGKTFGFSVRCVKD